MRRLVVTDVGVEEDRFALLYPAVAVFQVGTASTQRFDLPPGQDQPGFIGLFNSVIVPGSAVNADRLLVCRRRFCHKKAVNTQLSASLRSLFLAKAAF